METNTHQIDFGRALEKFIDIFLELHPKQKWPTWFKSCTTYHGSRESEKLWRFSFTANQNHKLKENECWEETDSGGKVLVRADASTGEKKYIISNTEGLQIILFEALIDLSTLEARVLKDNDLDLIDGSNFTQVN